MRAGGNGEILDGLKDVGLAIRSLLGKSCEVVIHHITDLGCSVVWIDGDLTGRSVGDMVIDWGSERLREGKRGPVFNHVTHSEKGRTLRNACVWLRDSRGEVCGSFCIILDVTPVMHLEEFTRDLAPDYSRPDLGEKFASDLGDMIDTIIAECEYRLGAAAEEMSKEQRMEVVRILDDRGAFQVRNSAPIVADLLGVTRKTIYNYLREIALGAQSESAPD